MSNAWLIWWLILCTAAVVNVAAWFFAARVLGRRAPLFPADTYATRRLLLWLAAGYVLGCAFRSVLPMVDVPRTCLHDTWISRIVVGRSVATLAELCFAAQWALLLREAGVAATDGLATRLSRTVVPLILVAELSCWFAVLTSNYLLHATENFLWTMAAVLVVGGLVSVRERVDERSRRFLGVAIVSGVVYVAFMTIVDVPMYVSRWQADLAAGHEYLSLGEGARVMFGRCIVTREWAAWRNDVPWLTLYFTVGVWISIALAHAPPLRAAQPTARA